MSNSTEESILALATEAANDRAGLRAENHRLRAELARYQEVVANMATTAVKVQTQRDKLLGACQDALDGLEQLLSADGTLGDKLRKAIAVGKEGP